MGESSGYQVSGDSAQIYEQVASAFLLPWADDLVEAAGLRSGDRVLDLACGTGFVARRASAEVGHAGVVEGVDVNPMMAAECRRATGLTVHEAPAEASGLADDRFDVVLCQQGLQYFPDKSGALQETGRVLAPGGRVAFSVWAEFEYNPFIEGQVAALEEYLDPEGVAAFRGTNVAALGGAEGMGQLFSRSGFDQVEVRRHDLSIVLPPMDSYFPALIAATPWAGVYAGLSDAQQAAVVDHMTAVLEPLPDGRGSRAHMATFVATASLSDRR